MVKDKFYIEDYTAEDKKNAKESANKKKVRNALRANIQRSINFVTHKEPESKISRLKRIFSLNGDDETIITLRYGTIIFYQGIIRNVRIFNGKNEDFSAKREILEQLDKKLDDNKWFNDQYSKYLKIKEGADKKSITTKKLNKNNSKTISKPKSSAKKVSNKPSKSKVDTKKASATKVSAKSSAKKRSTKSSVSKASSKKASSKTIKKK